MARDHHFKKICNPSDVREFVLVSPRTSAVTLIETLVAISIILVLSALLFPALALGKVAALRATSLENLRQISHATIIYAGDSDDFLPFYRNDETLLASRDPDVTTTGIPTDSAQPMELVRVISAYMGGNKNVWFCPADSYRGTTIPFGETNHMFSSYLYLAFPSDIVKYGGMETLPWPILSQADALYAPGALFQEASGNVKNNLRSYWSAPTLQASFVDGSVHSLPVGR